MRRQGLRKRSRAAGPLVVCVLILVSASVAYPARAAPLELTFTGPSDPSIGTDTAYGGRLTLASEAGGVPLQEIQVLVDGTPGATATTDLGGAYEVKLPFREFRTYRLEAVWREGTAVERRSPVLEVRAQAPPLDPTVASNACDAGRFLYSGSDPIQSGLASRTIECRRAAVLSGRVLDGDGDPLSGVTVTVHAHEDLGRTVSRADGAYDLAVNGGGPLTVDLARDGYLPAQRQVDVRWNAFEAVPEVRLVALDPVVTTVELSGGSTEAQLAEGSLVTDEDGTRQAALLFAPGTTATMTLPDGTQSALDTGDVRITEYTVGLNGPDRMPATLPPSSAYTYAAEFSIDQALEAGATRVDFGQPVIAYVSDFLGFPAGDGVPLGYYDRDRAQWVAAQNGRVIGIVGETDGLADVDGDGDGAADGLEALDALGVLETERRALAGKYDPGAVLWRIAVEHFSPYDFNWPYVPVLDPNDPRPNPRQPIPEPQRKRESDDDCKNGGSIVYCRSQTLGERLPVAGTSYTLNYRSDRVAGVAEPYAVDIPLTGPHVPPNLVTVGVVINGPGYRPGGSFGSARYPAAPNIVHAFRWDGTDNQGRVRRGTVELYVTIYYIYEVRFQYQRFDAGPNAQAAFARYYGEGINDAGLRERPGLPGRTRVTRSQSYTIRLERWDVPVHQAPGGWSLDVHHTYDPSGVTVYRGDGERYSASSLSSPQTLSLVAGEGSPESGNGDGGRAVDAALGTARSVDVGPDGSVYIADPEEHRIRKVDRSGIITTFAGTGEAGYAGDGGPATGARIDSPAGIALGADGSLYIADDSPSDEDHIRRVGPDGVVATIGGHIDGPRAIAAAADGSVFVAYDYNRVGRIGTDGLFTNAVGSGSYGTGGDGGPAPLADLSIVDGLAVGPDGSLYISVSEDGVVRRVSPEGIIETVIENFDGYGEIQGLDVAGDGSLFVAHGGVVWRYSPDGVLLRAAGSPFGGCRLAGGQGPSLGARLCDATDVAVGPDGDLVIADSDRVVRSGSALPRYLAEGGLLIPSADGAEIYVFDVQGRHLQTLDGVTGGVRLTFGYDAQGRLIRITDAGGRDTSIQRDAAGNPVAIVAPGGETTLTGTDANGYLNRVEDPTGAVTSMTYTAEGLLTKIVRPSGEEHTFGYDGRARLVRDTAPDGGVTRLARTERPDGFDVTVTDPEGRATVYSTTERDYDVRLATRYPGGETESAVVGRDGTRELTAADGTVTRIELAGDPRWGMVAPYASEMTVTLPDGRSTMRTETREAALADPRDVFSLTSATDVKTFDGTRRLETRVDRDGGGGATVRVTSPEGRVFVTSLDDRGRPTSYAQDGLNPITYSYDPAGRLAGESQGDSTHRYVYEGGGDRLTAHTDPQGNVTRFTYDAAGRVIGTHRPSGLATSYAYDADGRLVRVVEPNGTHEVTRDHRQAVTSYRSPAGESLEMSYDLTGARASTTLPSGREQTLNHDAAGRLVTLEQNEATNSFAYIGGSLRPDAVTRTAAGDTQGIDLGFAGPLLDRVAFTGPSTGTFTYAHDAAGMLTQVALAGGPSDAVAHDGDGLRTRWGPYTLTREGPAGEVSRISDGSATFAYTYDSRGRPAGRTLSVNAVRVYDQAMIRDPSSRLSSSASVVAGAATERTYVYDVDRRLTLVRRNGQPTEAYDYDPNGNRSGVTRNGQTVTATFDADGRATRLGSVTYTYDGDGFLATRGNDTFSYGSRGELLEASLAGGGHLSYSYDAFGRRVARTRSGIATPGDPSGTTQYLYGNPEDVLQVTAVREPSGGLTSLYYDEEGRLIGIARGSLRYSVATDHLGTPVAVADPSGAIVKQLDHDSFGVQLSDGAPGFALHVGFAGGLADAGTGLVHFGSRDYIPELGQWAGRDPTLFGGGQAELYGYVGGDPVNRIDSTGRGLAVEVGAGLGLYLGIKAAVTGDGFSFCWEGGLGIGAGIEVDPLAGLDADGSSVVAEVSGEVFGVGVSGKLEKQLTGPCPGDVTAEVKGCVGPACGRVDNKEGLGGNLSLAELAGAELQAKTTAKRCMGGLW